MPPKAAPEKQRIAENPTGEPMTTDQMVRILNTRDARMRAVESFMVSCPFRF